MFKHFPGMNANLEVAPEIPDQIHDHDGIETEIDDILVHRHRRGIGVKHLADGIAELLFDELPARLAFGLENLFAPLARHGGLLRLTRNFGKEWRSFSGVEEGLQCGPVRIDNANLRDIAIQQHAESRKAFVGIDAGDALLRETAAAIRLCRHTDFGPWAPIDTEGGQPLRAAVGRQGVEVGVRRGVIPLPHGTEHGRRRGEHNKEIEFRVCERAVQIPCACHLGSAHGREGRGVHVVDKLIVEYTCGVDDATDSRPLFVVVLREECGELRSVRHVDSGDMHGCAGGFELANGGDVLSSTARGIGLRPLVPWRQGRTRQQYEAARAVLHQPLRQLDSEATETAGDQIRAVGTKCRVQRRLDLSKGSHARTETVCRTQGDHALAVLREHLIDQARNGAIVRHVDQLAHHVRVFHRDASAERP